MKHLALLIFCCYSLLAGAQQQRLSAGIASQAAPCDNTLKQFRVIRTGGLPDSVVWSREDTVCLFSVELGLAPGTYLLKVRSQEASLEWPFEVTAGQTEIALGNLLLEPVVSELEEVTITGVPKRFIQIDAEKTTVTVENNPVLEVSSVYDAILKIPGIIPYPGGGFAMGGQQASIWFDGIPSSLSTTDIDNLLKSLPATSVQKIELIQNPGASYDANVGGAIIDIISQGRANKWLSGTVTLNAGFNRNQKYTPSLMLSGKGRKYTWQVQTGHSYFERNNRQTSERSYNYFDTTARLRSERLEETTDRFMYLRPSFSWRFDKKSLLQVNAGLRLFQNDLDGSSVSDPADSTAARLMAGYRQRGRGWQVEGGAKYRLFLDTLDRKIEIGANLTHSDYGTKRLTSQTTESTTWTLQNNGSVQNVGQLRIDAAIPFPKWKAQLNTGVKLSLVDVLSEGGYRFNDSLEPDMATGDFELRVPFRYVEWNKAVYIEWKQRVGKRFAATAGLRGEDFSLEGKVLNEELLRRNYRNLFPSLHLLYRVIPEVVNVMASYSRKISLPGYNQFDPNVSGYYDNYTSSTGNAALEPNFFHRSNAKITVFDYLQISVDHSLSNSVNLGEVKADSGSYAISQTYRTYKNVQTWSYFFALPVPFGFFKQGMKFFDQPIDVDAISFVYLYAENNKTIIPGYQYVNGNRSLWTIGAYSQFILPWKIRMNVEYNYTAKGMFQISETTRPVHDLEIVFSREFSDKKWRVSVTAQDVLNSNRNYGRIAYAPLTISSYYKQDTRVFWFKVARSFGRYERPSLEEEGFPSRGGL